MKKYLFSFALAAAFGMALGCSSVQHTDGKNGCVVHPEPTKPVYIETIGLPKLNRNFHRRPRRRVPKKRAKMTKNSCRSKNERTPKGCERKHAGEVKRDRTKPLWRTSRPPYAGANCSNLAIRRASEERRKLFYSAAKKRLFASAPISVRQRSHAMCS